MPGSTYIVGEGGQLKVGDEGEVHVALHTHPVLNESTLSVPFREYFKNSSASEDMRVNGATTNVDFTINAREESSVWIKSISIKLADPGAKFNLFGALAALSNGVEFTWFTQLLGEIVIHEGIKTNLQFFRLSDQVPTIIDLSGGGDDAITVYIDLAKIFGNQYGLKLSKGTKDRLTFRIKDNLSAGLSEFNAIAYGIAIEHA